MDEKSALMTRWLRVLMYIAAASLVNSLVSYFPFVPANLTTWISRGIMVAMILCMFRLGPAHGRYRKAGILRGAMLGCALITAFLFGSVILSLAASLLSFAAVYQEYKAHSELVADKDASLSQRWMRLFIWSILASVLLSAGTTLVAVIVIAAKLKDASRISGIAICLLGIPRSVIEIIYILYIRKMVLIFEPDEAW